MLSTEELLRLLKDIESDRVERTESTKDTDKFGEAICAFSNDLPGHGLPGYLILGAKSDGMPSGLRVTDQLLQNLAAIRSDGNVQPLPMMSVNKYVLPDSHELAVVEVQPSDMPPVRYKGRVHIRVGPRRGIATETEERRLLERRTASARTFDAQPCIDCRLDDLVLDLFLTTYRSNALAADAIRENSRDVKLQMASLRFFELRRDCATHAGALLFASDPLRWLPGAFVQFVRFAGSEYGGEVVAERRFSGDLLTVLRDLDSPLVSWSNRKPVPETALRETWVSDYPEVAVKELLMNAVMHRDYQSNTPVHFYWFDDRIEIQNPGGLYPEARPDNFPRVAAYRNPVVAEAMRALGYVYRYGTGVDRCRRALQSNGNPPPEFLLDQPGYFLVTVRRRA
jgi:ATP-dependent DNA helicase RecG